MMTSVFDTTRMALWAFEWRVRAVIQPPPAELVLTADQISTR